MRTKQIDAWMINCHFWPEEMNKSKWIFLPCKGTGEMSKKCRNCSDWGYMYLTVTAGRKR